MGDRQRRLAESFEPSSEGLSFCLTRFPLWPGDCSLSLAFALFHAGHGFVGLGFGLEGAAHAFHGGRWLAMHHRAFVACRIECHIKLFGEGGRGNCDNHSSSEKILFHWGLVGIKEPLNKALPENALSSISFSCFGDCSTSSRRLPFRLCPPFFDAVGAQSLDEV